jgi:putative endonuclease
MKEKINTGRIGEEKAVQFLRKNGYCVLARNFRNKLGEIDVIARQGGVICFIEVRTRKGLMKHGEALESVGPAKQHKLSKLALSVLKEKKWLERTARFDVVSVSLNGEQDSFVLLKDAFPVVERYA